MAHKIQFASLTKEKLTFAKTKSDSLHNAMDILTATSIATNRIESGSLIAQWAVVALTVVGLFVACGLPLTSVRRPSKKVIEGLQIIGGGWIVGVCFAELLPELYASAAAMSRYAIWAVLVGFAFQQALELFETREVSNHTAHGGSPALGLGVALAVHGYIEGMALISAEGLRWNLLLGILMHNIPLALLFAEQLASRHRATGTLLLMAAVASATPIGAATGIAIDISSNLQQILTGFVVGVLLHVAADALKSMNNWKHLLLMIAASATALML